MGLAVALVATGIIVLAVSVLAGLALRRHLVGDAQAGLNASRRGLSRAQRWRVARAVSRGRRVADQALAGAVIVRARYVQHLTARAVTGPWRWLLPVAAAFQVLSAAIRAMNDGPWTALRVTGLVLQLLAVPLALLWPSQLRRAGHRAERAERLNLTPGGPHLGGSLPPS